MSIAGGWLFGLAAGAVLALVGAVTGATALFILVRLWIAPRLPPRVLRLAEALRPRLERDGFGALVAMRLIPLIPFWLGNIAPALIGMRLVLYVIGTALGIAPTCFILAGIGAGAGDQVSAALDQGMLPNTSVLLAPNILLPLLALAALSILPAVLRRLRSPRD